MELRIVTLSGKEINQFDVYQYGIFDHPSNKHKRAIPRDEIAMSSLYEENADLEGIKKIVDLNPGCQLYVIVNSNSTGFWVPVTLEP